MSENMAHCSTIWSNIRKLEHIAQQYEYCSRNYSTLLGNIQPPTWKKHRIESSTNPSYYYTPESVINITLAGAFTSNATSTFRRFPFQSKQKKEDLLGPYSTYFKEFKSRSPTPSEIQSPPLQPDFGITDLWEPTKSEKEQEKEEEKESEDQEFTYQNLITKNLDIEIPNF
ncbi:hypothetical protein G9A89_006422 [Geosiphon pyriformis]|nr:hypothetical protein G9A89_006422 [Geosiphon pyriformis]